MAECWGTWPPRTAPLALERKERTHVSHAGAARRAYESAEACGCRSRRVVLS